MTADLATIFGLALVDSLSPSILGMSLYFILAQQRYLSRVTVYILTVFTAYLGIGIAFMLGFDISARTLEGRTGDTIIHTVQLVVGLILLIRSLKGDAKAASRPRRPRSQAIGSVVLLGLMVTLAEMMVALPYFGAIGILAGTDFGPTQWLPILVAYNAVAMLPSVAVIAIAIAFRERQRERFQRWLDKLDKSSSGLWLMGIAGVLLIRNGGAFLLVDLGVLHLE